MSVFNLNPVPAIVSGAGCSDNLPDALPKCYDNSEALLIFDPGLSAAGIITNIEDQFVRADAKFTTAILPEGEPKESFIRNTASYAKAKPIRGVICVGGGSAIDAGKLICSMIETDQDVSEFRLAATELPKRCLPLICVPTTSGTGAEVTTTSIISEESGTKNWFWSEGLRPDQVFLDPKLTVGLPPKVTATTGLDALVHALEAATNSRATDINSMYSERALELIRQHLFTAVQRPDNLAARSGMQQAATLAGIAIDNAGTCLAHAIGHALGTLIGMPHGQAVTIGLCASLEWSIEGFEQNFERSAAALGLQSASDLPAFIKQLALDCGVDLTVPSTDLDAKKLATQMMNKENIAMVKASCKPVAKEDCLMMAKNVLALSASLKNANETLEVATTA